MNVEQILHICQQRAVDKNLSQAQLSQRIGVERSQLSHWFSGRYKPSAARLFDLIDAVGLKIQLTAKDSQDETSEEPVQSSNGSTKSFDSNKPSETKALDEKEETKKTEETGLNAAVRRTQKASERNKPERTKGAKRGIKGAEKTQATKESKATKAQTNDQLKSQKIAVRPEENNDEREDPDLIKPIRRAPAFENLSPEGVRLAREMFGLDLSDFND